MLALVAFLSIWTVALGRLCNGDGVDIASASSHGETLSRAVCGAASNPVNEEEPGDWLIQ
jgi:hypothetical protein